MINDIKTYFTNKSNRIRFLKFATVGFSGVIVNNGLLWILVESTLLHFYLCSLIAIEISIFTNFLLNDNWTWKDRREGHFFHRFLRYNTSTAFSSIVVNISILLLFKEWIGIPYLLANLIGIGCAMISNFILNSIWTYGKKRLILPLKVKIILFISLIIRLLIAAGIGPGFDEAYYYVYSIHPSLSYFDHPPLVGFLAGFFPYLTGIVSVFTIRLGAVILFTAAGLIFYRLSKNFLSENEAFIAYVLLNITPIFFLGAGVMILPDAGLLFFWIATLFVIHRILIKNDDRLLLWITAGILTGLTMLSKYLGVFLGFSLILHLLIKHPKKFLRIHPYAYGATAFIVFLPVVIWNLQHDFISFTFQGSRAVSTSLSLDTFGEALGGQAGYLTPMIFLPLIYIIWLTFKKGVLKNDREYFFYFIFGALPVIIINVISFLRSILPHWTMPGYIILCLPLARLIKEKLKTSKLTRLTVKFTIIFIIVILGIAFLHVRYGILHLEKLAEQDIITKKEFFRDATLDQHGWQHIDKYLQKNDINPEKVFLFTHKWYLSGEVEFAVKGKFDVMCFNKKDSRGYGIWDSKVDMTGKDGICIYTNRYKIDPQKKFADYFESFSPPDSLTIKRGSVVSKWIYFQRCHNLIKPYPLPYSTPE